MTDAPRLIGRTDAATYCGITPTAFSAWVRTHIMPPAIPGTRKWDKKAIDAKLDEISGLLPESNPVDEFAEWERRKSKESDLDRWRKERAKRRREKV